MPVWRGLLDAGRTRVLGASEEAVGLPPGQMGNSEVGPPQPRRRPAGAPGPAADRRRDRRRLVLRAAGAARRLRAGRPSPAAGSTSSAWSARAASTPTTATSSRSPSSPPARACRRSASTPCSTAATRRRARRSRSSRTSRRGSPRPTRTPGSRRSAAATTRWTATSAGSGSARGYDAIVHGVGERAPSATAAIEAAYARGENDEFVAPTVIDGVDGRVRDGDPIVHANFRADRARQLTHALADGDDVRRLRPDRPRPAPARPARRDDDRVRGRPAGRGRVPARGGPTRWPTPRRDAGWRQFHVAETEKYAHVTYFFNGGREAPLPGEDRLLVPSPKVATYDLQPEMSAAGVDRRARRGDRLGRLRLHRRELRQPGHGRPHRRLGRRRSRAVETVDACLGRIVAALDALDARRPGRPGHAARRHRRPRQRRRDARRRRPARSRPTR